MEYRGCQRFFVLLIGILLSFLMILNKGYAQITLELKVFPPEQTIDLSSPPAENIAIIAKVNLEGVNFNWELTGPGQLIEKKQGEREVQYIPPKKIHPDISAEAVITVTVTDDTQKNVATDTITLKLLGVSEKPSSRKPTSPVVSAKTSSCPSFSSSMSIAQLLKLGDTYFENTFFITPECKNAFAVYREILRRQSSNSQAREKIHAMISFYKKWGNRFFKRGDVSKAQEYYKGHQLLASYMVNVLHEQRFVASIKEVQQYLDGVEETTTIKPSVTPTLMPTAAPTPQPTATPTPQPTATPTPQPTATPTPRPTATPTPQPTATPTPRPKATPTPRPTATPTPFSEIDLLLKKADGYFYSKNWTTPKGRNAFEVYRKVLIKSPSNDHAKQKIRAIASIYKKRGDDAYKENTYLKAYQEYQKYLMVVDYLLETLRDYTFYSQYQFVQNRSRLLIATPTPRPTATPKPVFRVKSVLVKDKYGKMMYPASGVYSVYARDKMSLTVNVDVYPHRNLGVSWTTGRGKLPSTSRLTNTYMAKERGGDYVTIYIWDTKTGEEVSETVNIMVK